MNIKAVHSFSWHGNKVWPFFVIEYKLWFLHLVSLAQLCLVLLHESLKLFLSLDALSESSRACRIVFDDFIFELFAVAHLRMSLNVFLLPLLNLSKFHEVDFDLVFNLWLTIPDMVNHMTLIDEDGIDEWLPFGIKVLFEPWKSLSELFRDSQP